MFMRKSLRIVVQGGNGSPPRIREGAITRKGKMMVDGKEVSSYSCKMDDGETFTRPLSDFKVKNKVYTLYQ